MNKCIEKDNLLKEYNWKRDFLFMTHYVIKYNNQLDRPYTSQRYIESMAYCNLICKDIFTQNNSNCNCHA